MKESESVFQDAGLSLPDEHELKKAAAILKEQGYECLCWGSDRYFCACSLNLADDDDIEPNERSGYMCWRWQTCCTCVKKELIEEKKKELKSQKDLKRMLKEDYEKKIEAIDKRRKEIKDTFKIVLKS